MAKALILPAVLLIYSCIGVQTVHGQPHIYPGNAAPDEESGRPVQRDEFLNAFRTLSDNGRLDAAEAALEEAQHNGLDQPSYQQCVLELEERRGQARQLIQTGDTLLRAEHYKEARLRYEQARRIDRDNTLVAGKIAMAERFEREARARVIRETIGFAIPIATRTLSDYFEFKREEERRKHEEAELAAEEARAREREQQRRRP